MKVYVNIEDARWRKYKIDFTRIARAAGAGRAGRNAVVSITLTNDREIRKLNRQYRGIDRATNVLSFELGDAELLGDIFISIDTVRREARTENISVADHTAHMVVHGVLHLLGYDHINEDDAVVMESLETKILGKMGIKNPYAEPTARRMSPWLRGLLLMVFGAAATLGFAPFYLWPITLMAVAAAYWLLTRDNNTGIWRAYLRAMPFGAAYAIAMFWWTLHSIYVVPELMARFAIWTVPGVLGLGLAGAIVFSVPFAAAVRVRNAAARPFVFACAWTIILWMREWVMTGFPWNPIANIAIPIPWISNSMALFGALGLTFVIVGLIAAAVEIVRNKKSAMCIVSGIILMLAMCGGIIFGIKNISKTNYDTGPVIRIVQPATSQSDKIEYTSRADALRRAEEKVMRLIEMAGDAAADIVVYPETSYPFAIVPGDAMPIARALGTNVIIGATTMHDGNLFNSMVMADASGQIYAIYDKVHLVPFGEYAPMGGLLPAPINLARGVGRVTIDAPFAFSFAPAICYEIIFTDSIIAANHRPDAIINITNDTWFGNTPGTYQHMDMVRRYAIESGTPIIRANYSGISAFIATDGRIISQMPIGASGYLDGRVGKSHMTAYRMIGRDGWMAIILLFSFISATLVSYLCKRD